MKFFGIFRIFFEQLRSVFVSIAEIREAKRIRKKSTVDVYLIDENNLLRKVKGKLDKEEEFILLEELNTIYFKEPDTKYYDEKLNPVFFISNNNHYALNLNDLSNLDSLKFATNKGIRIRRTGKNPKLWEEKIKDKDKNKDNWKKINKDNLKEFYKTIDLRELDKWDSKGNTGFSFSVDAKRIFDTKTLEFLEEVAKRTILIVLTFGITIGMILMGTILYWLK